MNMPSAPKVSVCIPTYNYGRFIGDAVSSVLLQSYRDLELIVVDNCSTDDTRRLCEGFIEKDARVRYFCNPVNLGMVGNWNRCMELARGEYVKILCADDMLEPGCIARSAEILERNRNVALVTGTRLFVSEKLQPLLERSYSDRFRIVPGNRAIRTCLMFGNVIGEPSAVMFRRVDVSSPFDDRLKQLIDLDMWIRILEKGDLANIPEPVCRFRQHADQGTADNIRSQAFIDEELWLYRHYSGKRPGLTPLHRLIAKLTLTFRIYKLGYNRNPQLVREILCREVGSGYYLAVHCAKSVKELIFKRKH